MIVHIYDVFLGGQKLGWPSVGEVMRGKQDINAIITRGYQTGVASAILWKHLMLERF